MSESNQIYTKFFIAPLIVLHFGVKMVAEML